jgi:hypothetical protein
MDEDDVMGDDWRRLWAELVKRPLEETIVKEVKAQPGGPTLYTLKLWVRGSRNPSEATIGSLIETLSKVYRNDVAEVLQKYIQVCTGDVSTEHGKDFVMGSNPSLHPDHSFSNVNQKAGLEAVSSDRVVATPEGSVVVSGRQDISSVSSPSKETTCASDHVRVTSDHVTVVKRCCSDKWQQMGRSLLECDSIKVLDVVSVLPPTAPNSEKLQYIIEEWMRKNEEPTVNQLIKACSHPDVDRHEIVIRSLRGEELL